MQIKINSPWVVYNFLVLIDYLNLPYLRNKNSKANEIFKKPLN